MLTFRNGAEASPLSPVQAWSSGHVDNQPFSPPLQLSHTCYTPSHPILSHTSHTLSHTSHTSLTPSLTPHCHLSHPLSHLTVTSHTLSHTSHTSLTPHCHISLFRVGKNYTFDKRFSHGAKDSVCVSTCVFCLVPWDRYQAQKTCCK